MTAGQRKLARKFRDADLAEKLIEAGLHTPKKIKKVKAKDLEKLVGRAKADAVRGRLSGK